MATLLQWSSPGTTRRVRGGLAAWTQRLTLPWGLTVLYALGAVADSLPLTATTDWLNNDLKMPLATQSMFYAATFLPYSLKPLYGAASEAWGSRRGLYVAATLVEAVLYLVTAFGVTSIAGAFAVVFVRDTCAACAEMMLSATLADVVAVRGKACAACAQAEAAGARWVGTIAGYLIQLWLYRCTSSSSAPPAATVIASTAAVLVPTALFAAVALTAQDVSKEKPTSLSKRRALATASLLVLFQVLFIWIALKDVLVLKDLRDLWRGGLWTLVSLVGASVALLALLLQRHTQQQKRRGNSLLAEPLLNLEPSSSSSPEELLEPTEISSSSSSTQDDVQDNKAEPVTSRVFVRGLFAPAILVFALNAAPTAGVQISNLEYYLFFSAKPCYLPYMNLIVAGTSLLACVVAARLRRISFLGPLALLISVNAVASLVYGPLAHAKPIGVDSSRVCLLGLCVGRFAYDVIAKVLNAITSELALVAETTLTLRCALSLSGPRSDAAIFGALLSLVDAGSSVSGWIAAPLVTRANLSFDNFSHLPWLLRVCVYAKLLALLPLPFVHIDE